MKNEEGINMFMKVCVQRLINMSWALVLGPCYMVGEYIYIIINLALGPCSLVAPIVADPGIKSRGFGVV